MEGGMNSKNRSLGRIRLWFHRSFVTVAAKYTSSLSVVRSDDGDGGGKRFLENMRARAWLVGDGTREGRGEKRRFRPIRLRKCSTNDRRMDRDDDRSLGKEWGRTRCFFGDFAKNLRRQLFYTCVAFVPDGRRSRRTVTYERNI